MNRAEVYVDFFRVFYELADQRCRDYWGTSKPNGQAAGLESLCAFAGLVVAPAAKSMVPRGNIDYFRPDAEELFIVDAGAGASSAVLRTYFKNVITCDPDVDYLAQVKRACESMGLGHGWWGSGVPACEWDACFYDYGTSVRGPLFPKFLDKTRRLIWIDDAHDRDLLSVCRAACAERGLQLEVAHGSVDEHGRFGAYAQRT